MSWKRPPPRQPKQIEGSIGPRASAPSIGLAAALSSAPVVPARVPPSPRAVANLAEVRGRRIRESARGEDCSIRMIGVCNHDSATTVWSHWPGLAGGRGMGLKSNDLCGAYACSACHDVVDMRSDPPEGMTRQAVEIDWHEGHLRSLVRLCEKGIV